MTSNCSILYDFIGDGSQCQIEAYYPQRAGQDGNSWEKFKIIARSNPTARRGRRGGRE